MFSKPDRHDVLLPIQPHPSNEQKQSTSRTIALMVAIVLIGGVSIVAFACSPVHESSRFHAAGVASPETYRGSISTFEVQQQLSNQDVLKILSSVGLFSRNKLVQLADKDLDGFGVLNNLTAYSGFVVVACGSGKPQRRVPSQPFVSVDPGSRLFPVVGINTAAQGVEVVLGRRLHPLTFTATKFDTEGAAGPPYVVYEVSSGQVWVNQEVMESLLRPRYLQQLITSVAKRFGEHTAAMLGKAAPPSSLEALLPLLSAAFGLAVSSAFGVMVPMWFCIACPVVLGLAVPLLINLGLGELASTVCSNMALPDEQCLDLWLGALLVGFVLSMASALPIFKICKLYQCEHHSPPLP